MGGGYGLEEAVVDLEDGVEVPLVVGVDHRYCWVAVGRTWSAMMNVEALFEAGT